MECSSPGEDRPRQHEAFFGCQQGGDFSLEGWVDDLRTAISHLLTTYDPTGAIHRRDFPPSVEEWAREFRRFRPVASARRFARRPLLVMHGEGDDSVPVSDARQLVNAHGSAELSLFEEAGHRLRHDPRAVAAVGMARPHAIDARAPAFGTGLTVADVPFT